MVVAAKPLRSVAGGWRLMALLIVLGALGGFGYTLVREPVYAAKAYVVVVSQNSNDSTAVSYAQAYARIASQGDALAEAVNQSNGRVTPTEIRRAIRTSSSPDAPVIEITGSANPASYAADLANFVANGLISTANRNSADTRVKLVLLSAAEPPTDPASPRPTLVVAVGAATGLLLGGLALLGRASRGGTERAGEGPGPTQPIGIDLPQQRRYSAKASVAPVPPPVRPDWPNGSVPNGSNGTGNYYGGASHDGDVAGGDPARQTRRVARGDAARRQRPL